MEIRKQTYPASAFEMFSSMSSLKEVECIVIGKVRMVSMPKLVVVANDGKMYFRLPSMEERNSILDLPEDEENAFTQSHRLIYPKTSYILSQCGQIAIHPTLHQRMKIIYKMNNKFSPQIAINMCANYCSFIINNCSEGLNKREVFNEKF